MAIILLAIYVVLAFEIVHRTVIVLVAAAIAITIGITTGLFQADKSFEFAIHSIDFNTIDLLLGMMIIVTILAETGIFQYIGIKMSKASKGNMWKLLVMMSVFTAVTSMFIDNVTTILLMIPVTISIFKTFRMSPVPFILAQVLASNVGGNGTLIGSSAGVIAIGLSEKYGYRITFNQFFKVGFPFMIITVAVDSIVLMMDVIKILANWNESWTYNNNIQTTHTCK